MGGLGDGVRRAYRWLKLWTGRLLIAAALLALGAVIGIVAFPLLPAETRDFVERLVGG